MASTKVNFQASGYHTVTPHLMLRGGVEALEFYKKAFGATEVMRLPMPDGRLGHAEFQIGDSRVMLADEYPEMDYLGPQSRGGTTCSLLIYVADVDAAFQRAVDAGATVLQPVKDQFYGDRTGTVKDPSGHMCTLATHIEDVTPEEMVRRAAQMGPG